MIPRAAEKTLRGLAQGYPIIALTGPRQSGKTTLARQVFAAKPYVSLEDLDTRSLAEEDPRGFLAPYRPLNHREISVFPWWEDTWGISGNCVIVKTAPPAGRPPTLAR